MSSRSRNASQVTITHPGKVLYPQSEITKEDLANYYEQISDAMLPFIKNRPLSVVRCPAGIEASCFFQKHPGSSIPELPTTRIKEKSGTHEYGVVKTKDDLLKLVQANVLEIHSWGCSVNSLEHPDQIIFDLDPGPDVELSEVVDAALLLREFLRELKLESFVRLSGGKGYHVVVPIEPRNSWEEVKGFTQQIAGSLAADNPDKFIAVATKAKRKGKIFVDYLRNGRGATAIANYSTRAREGAPVALPIDWKLLSTYPKSADFTIKNVPALISRSKKLPWQTFFEIRQTIPID